MKLLVIGCGQAGGRISDEFALLNKKARAERGFDIVTNALAVNTDVADLSGLNHIRADYNHRILIGSSRTHGHGVGKMNEIGAAIAREDADKVLDKIRDTKNLPETDAFLVIGSAAGGTGSGSLPVITQHIKEFYPDKPVYNLIALPFKYEEVTEERSVYNVGTCLKSAYLVADAIFLVDNQRYISKNESLRQNLAKINRMIVKPFYNLLCAGEETDVKYIGSKVVDGGDIIQTLSGWSVIGYGRTKTSVFKLPFSKKVDFRSKNIESMPGAQAMNEALGETSLKCEPNDARKALYIINAPPDVMSMDLVKDLSAALREMAPQAIIRSGDYPRGKGSVDVTVILSELVNSRKVMSYFSKTINYMSQVRTERGFVEEHERGLANAFQDIPSLLS